MPFKVSAFSKARRRAKMRRVLSRIHLNLIAGVIALGILALSAQSLWNERQETWRDAELSAQNLLTALARDIGSTIGLLDFALKGVIEGLRYQKFAALPPEIQHRMLFDRAVSTTFTGTIMLLSAAGEIVADAGSIVAPRTMNFSQEDFFKAHQEHSFMGLVVSRPYRSNLRPGDPSIALSRRLSNPDGRFAGVVAVEISLSDLHDIFKTLNLGRQGSISLFRDDGILLMRQPYDEGDIGRDLSSTPNMKRFLQDPAGRFEGAAAIDDVRRFFTYSRIGSLPLILTVAVSVDEVLSPWRRKALAQVVVTGFLCAAILGLMLLFQRELRRRTEAEEELERLARTDTLTGLANRRAFDEFFDREWRQAIRAQAPISLLFIDADHFKQYNDLYGHVKGDDLLCAIAGAIDRSIRRPKDFAARYGGEEFVVLLPDTDIAGARVIADSICRAVSALGIAHEGSVFPTVTISIGAASARPFRGSARASLLEAADMALYQAKAAGRNCVKEREISRSASHERPMSNPAF
jgi:diguanylate cyclase (GGDEF)-like protein